MSTNVMVRAETENNEQSYSFKPYAGIRMPKGVSDMTKEEFDQRMAVGYSQAICGNVRPADDVFEDLLKELANVRATV